MCQDVILQGPSGHLWHVNMCCANKRASFTEGWESFVYDQFIEPGDVLVFRHVDDAHFTVQIFGPSGCEKLSTFSFQNYTSCCFREKNLNLSTICNKKRCEHRQNSTTASVSYMGEPYICENKASCCEKNYPTICTCTGEEKISSPHFTLSGINSAESNLLRNLPEFSALLGKNAISGKYSITIPQAFVHRWMSKEKVNRSFQVRLLYEKKPESWKLLVSRSQTQSRFVSGWKAFAISNGLQKGDKCVFKLLDKVEYIFEVHVIKHELHDDCGGRRGRNVTSARALVSHEKMKMYVVNPNPYPPIHEESINPHSRVEYKSVVGYGSHNPV